MGAEINEVAVFAAVTAVGLVCAAIVDATPFQAMWLGMCRSAQIAWMFTGCCIVQLMVLMTVKAADFFEVDFESVDIAETDTAGSSW